MPNPQAVISAFTEMAARYEQTVDRELRQFWGIGYQEFVSRLLDRAGPSAHGLTLDVATGRAVIPLSLTGERGWPGRVVGLDITRAMLTGAAEEVARCGRGERIRLVCGSGMQLPFADGTFDTAICALATHHMDVPALFAELSRVLRPGGQVLVADVGLASFWRTRPGRLFIAGLARWYARKEGVARIEAELDAIPQMRTPAEWKSFLLSTGFTGVELTVFPARHPWYPPGIIATGRTTSHRR